MEYMRTWVEVYPVAATEQGIWLLSGGSPWIDTDAVPADSTPWWAMERLLRDRGVRPSDRDDSFAISQVTAVVNHQTSCRYTNVGQVDTFITVLADGELLPGARPISLPAVELMGRPVPHRSTDLPDVISAADVLLHGLRHLRHLYLFDSTARRDMPALLAKHLMVLQPALAGLYGQTHQAAA
jgi:hypothetical protein